MKNKIIIEGARENNLKNISITIPKHSIVVFTGVSGSGKSSLVFDTIAAEAQRQLNETFTAFARNRLPKYGQPDVDHITNLSAPIIINQKRLGGNSRSTVGTITDIYALLRLLFARVGEPYAGNSNAFSFNDPEGMCPQCEGLGTMVSLDLDKFLDLNKSLNEGAILHPNFKPNSWYWKLYTLSGLFDNDKKLKDYTKKEWETLLYSGDATIALPSQGGDVHSKYEGLIPKFRRLYINKGIESMAEKNRQVFERFTTNAPCDLCRGQRLNEKALNCKITGYSIADLSAMEVSYLQDLLNNLHIKSVAVLLDQLRERLKQLNDIGLGYLSLNRETSTLSGGESQRIKMVRHLSSSLSEMMYIFDEPTVGLHPSDVHRLTELFVQLRDKGNTVLIVEHDPEVMKIADHIVDMGPNAGSHGGEVLFTGTYRELEKTGTLTGKYLGSHVPLKQNSRPYSHVYPIRQATAHNLKNVSVDIPAKVLTVVAGVAGSGKSSLIYEVFARKHPEAVVIDQSSVYSSRRSNPATYTGILNDIRTLFAKESGVSAALFTTNSEGACSNCQGYGMIWTDLAFMDGVKTVCEVCDGRGFKEAVLSHTYRNKSIYDVMTMTVAEAWAFFNDVPPIAKMLAVLSEVGLDYITLGQTLDSLSGGECQRLKIAMELGTTSNIYILDEPTTGLHMSDVAKLVAILDRLVDAGNTVVVIEHNVDVIKRADWIIELGPGGGSNGGTITFMGTPLQLLNAPDSITGKYLATEGLT
ncbi:excinuclease ABC subunit UvrA [Paenibacillus sp. J22TS3]|uniref:ATP-binding cassette domain-containing protein n=1 Tax=Paenibacillus sp. J22TS3 TaxID=2807192 RepID=UPI001B1F5C4F|nr:excinuclease ABC subunit UvrA [Paenibacillus sp. J22TS3]GIP20017.1 excinuclease ABC subunit A [Paenibacillus sp. J22TS3]